MKNPYVDPKHQVATGDSSWTLFLSSQNFNGPVAFFPPATWSRISKENLPAVGRGLDTRPARMDRGAMEFGIVPGLQVNLGVKPICAFLNSYFRRNRIVARRKS